MGMRARIRPLTLVEFPDGTYAWRNVEPHERRQRDRSLRGKARIKARKGR